MSKERSATIGVCPRCNDQLDIDALVGAGVAGSRAPMSVRDASLASQSERDGGRCHRDDRAQPTCPACHVALDVVDFVL